MEQDFSKIQLADVAKELNGNLVIKYHTATIRLDKEQLAFLRGYRRWGEYNADAVRYYMAQCYVYFLNFCDDDPEYCAYIRTWLAENCT